MEKLERYRSRLFTAAPVWNELLYGVRRLPPSNTKRMLTRYLEETIVPAIEILPYDEHAADWHAAERSRLSRAGRQPPFVDGQIASIAHVHNLVLVTFNVADFKAFRDLDLDDWSR